VLTIGDTVYGAAEPEIAEPETEPATETETLEEFRFVLDLESESNEEEEESSAAYIIIGVIFVIAAGVFAYIYRKKINNL
jgi:hypothetical protein